MASCSFFTLPNGTCICKRLFCHYRNLLPFSSLYAKLTLTLQKGNDIYDPTEQTPQA